MSTKSGYFHPTACAPTHLGVGVGTLHIDGVTAHARWEYQRTKRIVQGLTVRAWDSDSEGDAGAAVTYREIEDLSHTYPREENARILDWLMDG